MTAANEQSAPVPYTVLSPLEHDGRRHEPGAEVALTPEQAAPLLGHTVAPLEDAPEDPAPAEAPEEYHEAKEPTPIAARAGDGAGPDAAEQAPVTAAKPARRK
jgi:hypothetical protein